MTETSVPSVPPMPPHPPMPPNDPSPTAKKPRTNLVVIGSAVAVIAAVVATGVVVVQSRTGETRPAAAKSNAQDEDAVTAAKPDPEPTYSEVDADSFTVGLKTTARHCFGSAGCNVTVQPDLTFLGDSEGIDPDAVYDITYEIHGDESGPVIETAELSNRTSLSYTSSVLSTASAGTELSAEITDVSVEGG
ncbi:hypothetical protein JHN63_10585 [Streptomyces sp. MBT65]|uniref:hypothetical protein n=1 Tax=Streptomyces sp. MBT65 TaxID=1488395 RepID=UPI00190A3942|nr:hypothetical protein [Streptomyces sp. MBT65]MBK3574261.1 hypothetical protein [Streptomyces sp. MBT65]